MKLKLKLDESVNSTTRREEDALLQLLQKGRGTAALVEEPDEDSGEEEVVGEKPDYTVLEVDALRPRNDPLWDSAD